MWESGIIRTDDGKVVAQPGMTPDELRGSKVRLRAPAGLTGPGYERIDFGPVAVGGHEVVADAIFHNGRLKQIGLYLSEEEDKRLFANGKALTDELRFYNSWVEAEIGQKPPVRFPWGIVGATKDHWTAETSIFFNYT